MWNVLFDTVWGEIGKIPIMMGGMTHAVMFFVVNDGLLTLFFWRPEIKAIQESSSIDKNFIFYPSEKQLLIVPVHTDKERDDCPLNEFLTSSEIDNNCDDGTQNDEKSSISKNKENRTPQN